MYFIFPGSFVCACGIYVYMYIPVCTQLFFIFVCVSACSCVSAGAHLEVRAESRVLTLVYCLIWDRISYASICQISWSENFWRFFWPCLPSHYRNARVSDTLWNHLQMGIWSQVFDHWSTSPLINKLIKLGGTWIRMKTFLVGCSIVDRKSSKSRVQSKCSKRSIKLGKYPNWQEQGCVIQQIAFQFVGLSALLLPGIQGQSKCQLSIEGFQLLLLAW